MPLFDTLAGEMMKPLRILRKLGRRARQLLTPRHTAKPAPVDVARLKRFYAESGLHRVPDRFVLYRIIGNDLHPRHRLGVSRANVRFILEHEPALQDCEMRWVVNRIIDPAEEQAIIALLEQHGQHYIHLPFRREDYAQIGWDLDCFRDPSFLLAIGAANTLSYPDLMKEARARQSKNSYVMNNNGARNVALRAGRDIAKWVLPWDGNCFLTERAWAEIRAGVLAQPHLKYFVVPMARTAENRDLLAPDHRPRDFDEPQIMFRCDAREEFDPAHVYGRRSKVSLLWRLGVPGPWDGLKNAPWDQPRPDLSPEAGMFGTCGWVSRLESGRQEFERPGDAARLQRTTARFTGIIGLLDRLDVDVMHSRIDPGRLVLYDEELLEQLRTGGVSGPLRQIVRDIAADACTAVARGTFSVLDKEGCAPSGDRRDYWHPAPHWWPNPHASDGLPYVLRDGERRPGTELYEPGSEQFDRSNLQRVFEGAATCALAWRVTGDRASAAHGAALIRRWFVDPETRMNPHMRFAQVRMGWDNNEGNRTGIIEMRDICLLLEAARLLERAGALTQADGGIFRDWLGAYLEWLQTSRQGMAACRSLNNLGTFYDLQVAAIGAYLGDAAVLVSTFRRSWARLTLQFDPDGSQPHELHRPRSLHYCCFNLQGWMNLATIAARCGEDLWAHRSAGGSLARGADWLLRTSARRTWPYPQSGGFDASWLVPIRSALALQAPGKPVDMMELHRASPGYSPHSAIPPYWYLCLPNPVHARSAAKNPGS